MKKNKFKIFLLISIIPMLSFCAGAKEALEGKKRSDQSDEFLVKKKNPLQMPPDIDKLPMPGDDLQINTQEEDDVKKLLKIKDVNKDKDNSNNKGSNLLNNIIKKIQ